MHIYGLRQRVHGSTQAYRQTGMNRLIKTKAQAFDLKAIFMQNHREVVLCQAWLYNRLHYFIFEVLWLPGMSVICADL